MTLADLRFAVVDLETTSLEPSAGHILQIALVVADSSGTVLDTWSTYVKPPRWPLAGVGPTAIHGIRRSTLRGAPHAAEALRELAHRLPGCVFTAHNADFDLGFLRHHATRLGVALPEVSVFCTLALSRRLDPSGSLSHRLGDLCTRYGVTLTRAHDAVADATATAGVLPHLIAASGITEADALLAAGAPMPRRNGSKSRNDARRGAQRGAS